MRIAIIDDEEDPRAILRSYLLMEQSTATIKEADGVESGLELIRVFKPEIVFLDVMMRDGTGFDLLKRLNSIDFKLVIVSGHNEFALQAFRFSAIDYLVKPIDADELRSTFARIQSMLAPSWQQMLEVVRQSIQPAANADRKIILKDMNAVYVVSISSIMRCEASDNYTTFHLSDQPTIIVSRPLKEYDDLLQPFNFFRVHQSHLVNLHHLQQFNKREGGSIKMKDGSEVPVSSRKREALLAALTQFS